MIAKDIHLDIDELSCDYGDRRALEAISIAFERGSFTSVIGPNGSGKTTLLKAISRVIRPSEGVVSIDGQAIDSMSQREIARRMAVVPQETNHTFAFTVFEVVMMGRTPHLGRFKLEGGRDLEIAREAMERTDVWRLRDRPVTELSGGEKQRAVIAQALAQEPKIILLDEPTLHLDLNHQLEVMDLLKELNGEGLTVGAVLHDLNLAAYYADHLVLVKDGRLRAVGRAEEVLTAEMLREVFNAEALIGRHPVTGRIHVTVIPRARRTSDASLRVHLVCGSGTGVGIMNALVGRGYAVTVGVVNALDSDHEAAEALGLELVAEAPFSPISGEAYAKNLDLIKRADAVVVSAVPFGPANIRNLEAVLELEKGTRVFIIRGGERDFTGGLADRLLEELSDRGAVLVDDVAGLFDYLDAEEDG